MRKNRMMRAASALMVAVLLTTSTISGTFAKYVTTSSGEDTARVAKWGVELQVIGNLYGEAYIDNIVEEKATGVKVQSVNVIDTADQADDQDVVAPGTVNTEGLTFSINGRPEVAGEITTTMTIQNIFLKAGSYGVMVPVAAGVVTEANFTEFEAGTLFKKNGDQYVPAVKGDTTDLYTLEDAVTLSVKYYPVVYSLTGSTSTAGTTYANEDSLKAVADKIAEKLNLNTVTPDTNTSVVYSGTTPVSFDPNTDLAGLLKLGAEEINWEWAFERTTESDPNKAMFNGADTILGNLMAARLTSDINVVKLDGVNYVGLVEFDDYCLDTQFALDITVTQVN